MDEFRRMLWVCCQHSADHIPVSALQLVIRMAVWLQKQRLRGYVLAPWQALHKTLGHYGEIQPDGEGVAGTAVDHIFRFHEKNQAFREGHAKA